MQTEILEFLRQEGVSTRIVSEIEKFRKFYRLEEALQERIPEPPFLYYGREVWEQAAAALLAGENLLLDGVKASGKNVLAQGLALAFGRPEWDVSLYISTDAAALIGTDTFAGGEVRLRKGPVLRCAEAGGFGILDEINMAKNESLAVLHAVLDFRRVIDVPGYDCVRLHEATRFIGTMNYGYAGTRELNEALASRFMVIHMPVISEENLKRLIKTVYPGLREDYAGQFAELFSEIRKKCEGGEISAKAMDLRGLLSAIHMMEGGLPAVSALRLGVINKCFDDYERRLVEDIVSARLPENLSRDRLWN